MPPEPTLTALDGCRDRWVFVTFDLADAFAALWTAIRIDRGEAERLPGERVVDSTGVRMRIWV